MLQASYEIENSEETIRLVNRAFGQVTPQQQEIIYLKYFHGFTYDEISELLGIHNQSARNTVSRAFKLIREWIAAGKAVKPAIWLLLGLVY
jgi:RNA polymerase sigma factor (sigma-70 family)